MCDLKKLVGSSEYSDRLIHEVYGLGKVTGQKYGIELEVEGCGIDFGEHEQLTKWRVVEDGSLRNNGREFVSKVLSNKEINKALEELNSVFAEFAQTHASFRCGTHIHYNMSDRTVQQALEFLLASLLFENVLVAAFSPERRESVFCVSWSDTVGIHDIIRRWKSGNFTSALIRTIENSGKYRTINVLPLQRYGTIEFRMFPSTTNMEELRSFIEVLTRIDNLYKEVGISALIESVIKNPPAAMSYLFDGIKTKTSMKDMLALFTRDILHIGTAV